MPTFTADHIEYIGKISEWLRTAPSGEKSYGEFYIDLVRLSFEGVGSIGSFTPSEFNNGYDFTPASAQS